ncbi:MAG: plasmid replication protein, CyRepA1 family [Cyanobacteria bacterium P01_D01_bin.56]
MPQTILKTAADFQVELVEGSVIAPALAELNTEFLKGEALKATLFKERTPKNAPSYSAVFEYGALAFKILTPDSGFHRSELIRFKPVKPRFKKGGGFNKYESRPKADSTKQGLGFFSVDLEIWQRIADRCGVEIPDQLPIDNPALSAAFWNWAITNPVPLYLAEGEKKALCLLSHGYAAISLGGIRMGASSLWIDGKKQHTIHPELVQFFGCDRKWTILFDYAQSHTQRCGMKKAITALGAAIESQQTKTGWAPNQNSLKIILPPGSESGIDDLFARSESAARLVIRTREQSFEGFKSDYWVNWKRGIKKEACAKIIKFESEKYYSDTCPALPDEGVVALVGTMGLGKTHLIEELRKQDPLAKFLNIGHLVNLLENISVRLGTDLYRNLEPEQIRSSSNLSITFDSLHKLLNNKGELSWIPDVVFIDEVKQGIEHAVKSSTCKRKRALIIKTLGLILSQAKLVIGADANVDTITLDALTGASNRKPTVFWDTRLLASRDVYWYGDVSSSYMIDLTHIKLLEGQKVAIPSDSKKFLKKLERSFTDPQSRAAIAEAVKKIDIGDEDAPKIFVLSSDNSGSKEGRRILKDLNVSVIEYDAFGYTPSLGSGGDISVEHFDCVVGVFTGFSIDAERCVQMLYRVRPQVPMYIACRDNPMKQAAPITAEGVEQTIISRSWATEFLTNRPRSYDAFTKDFAWAHKAFCEFEAARNLSLKCLERDLKSLLINLGCNIIDCTYDENGKKYTATEESQKEYERIAKVQLEEHCKGVANAFEISEDEYKDRIGRDDLEPEERLEVERFRIAKTYSKPDVTPELVELDNFGRLAKKFHALDDLLAEPGPEIHTPNAGIIPGPPDHVAERDRFDYDHDDFLPDRRYTSAKWRLRYRLHIREIVLALINGEKLHKAHPLIEKAIEEIYQPGLRAHIYRILGFSIPTTKDGELEPMQVIRMFTDQLGLPIKSQKTTVNGERIPMKFLDTKSPKWELAQHTIATWITQRTEKKEADAKTRTATDAFIEQLNAAYNLPAVRLKPTVIWLKPDDETYHEHLATIARQAKIGVDIETFGNDAKNVESLHPWRGNIRLIQIATEDTTYVVDLGGRMDNRKEIHGKLSDFWVTFAQVMANTNVLKVGQNFHFDLRFLQMQYGIKAKNVACTLIGARTFFGDYAKGESKTNVTPILKGGYGLGNLVKRFLGVEIDKGEQSSDWGMSLTQSQVEYAALDPCITVQLHSAIERLYANEQHPLYSPDIKSIWQLENDIIPVACEMEANGMPCDLAEVERQMIEISVVEAGLQNQWAIICPDITYSQVGKLKAFINETYHLGLTKLDKAACAEHKDNPLISLRLKLRALQALKDNLAAFKQSAEKDGAIHSMFRTLTGFGRFSAGSSLGKGKKAKDLVNIQSISAKSNPALKEFNLSKPREAIKPSADEAFLVIDLAAAHARIAADLANDKTAIDAFNDPSIDNHSRVAAFVAQAVGEDWNGDTIAKLRKQPTPDGARAKSYRDTAKNTFYGFLNGAGPHRLQDQIAANTGKKPELEEVKAAVEGCKTLYPNIVQFQKDLMKGLDKTTLGLNNAEYVISTTREGSRIMLEKVESRFRPGFYEPPFTQSLAATWTRIEATAVKRALVELHQLAEDLPEMEIKLRGYIHDEVDITCAPEYSGEVAKLANDCIGNHFAAMLDYVSDGRESDPTKLIADSWAEK